MSEVEIKLLSQMTEASQISQVYEANLSGEVFEDDRHRVMFEFMMNYWKNSGMDQAPTWLVMQAEYPSVTLDDQVEETTHWLCDWLKRRYQVNKGQDIIRRAAKMLGEEQTKPDGDPGKALDAMWQEAYAAVQVTSPRTTRTDMSENIRERRERYNLTGQEQDTTGVSLGLTELDEHTRGLRPGELAAVGAYTKVGKSWLLAQSFVCNHRAGNRPLLFTLEMDLSEMEDRIDCLYSGVSYARFTRRELTIDDVVRLDQGREELARSGSAVLARPERGKRTVKTMLTQARQEGSSVVLVDQLSWIDTELHYAGEKAMTQKHGDLMAELKEDGSSASQGKIAQFCAIQFNRRAVSADATGSGRGGMDNFANSSMIEQTVDIALGLWRNQDMRVSNLMGLDVMGSRRCDKKSWMLDWHLTERTQLSIAEEYPAV